MKGWLNEAAFTAILLAALLDPDSRDTVTTVLLANTPADSLRIAGPMILQSAPGSVMDLVLGFWEQPNLAAIVVEAKRFESPSNPCWSAQGEWLWQTDVAVEDSADAEPPGWLWGVHRGFHDLGADFYDTRTDTERRKRNHIRHLEALGFTVTLQPVTPPATA
jgi:hypothetical protein